MKKLMILTVLTIATITSQAFSAENQTSDIKNIIAEQTTSTSCQLSTYSQVDFTMDFVKKETRDIEFSYILKNARVSYTGTKEGKTTVRLHTTNLEDPQGSKAYRIQTLAVNVIIDTQTQSVENIEAMNIMDFHVTINHRPYTDDLMSVRTVKGMVEKVECK